jgi:hypothetical protein
VHNDGYRSQLQFVARLAKPKAQPANDRIILLQFPINAKRFKLAKHFLRIATVVVIIDCGSGDLRQHCVLVFRRAA